MKCMGVRGIYQITCTKNGRRYIGSANCIGTRWKGHLAALRRDVHDNIHLQRAWNKYGKGGFVLEVLAVVKGNLLDAEQRHLDTLSPEFNIAKCARAPMRGRKMSPEARAKLSARFKGIPKSDEFKASVSVANKGLKRAPHVVEAMKNREFTPEHRAKMSASAKVKVFTKKHREAIGAQSRSYWDKIPKEDRVRTLSSRLSLANKARLKKCKERNAS